MVLAEKSPLSLSEILARRQPCFVFELRYEKFFLATKLLRISKQKYSTNSLLTTDLLYIKFTNSFCFETTLPFRHAAFAESFSAFRFFIFYINHTTESGSENSRKNPRNTKKLLTFCVFGANIYKQYANALIAQLDRVTGYEPVGRGFESLSARQTTVGKYLGGCFFVFILLEISAPKSQ